MEEVGGDFCDFVHVAEDMVGFAIGDASGHGLPAALMVRDIVTGLRMGLEKDDSEWLHNSVVKAQMKRMDPSFSEKSLGFRSFSDFLRSRSDIVDLDETSTTRTVRLHSED